MNSETMIQQITELKTAKEELLKQIRKTIIGQDKVVEQVLIGLFANGHMLIEGVPGLAKTLLISTIAKALNLSFGRIQFTPALMHSDITASDILLANETGAKIREIGHEYGATTGRERRCGWVDLPALKYACMINGATQLAMMKADVLDTFDTIQVCTHYEIEGERVDYFPYDIDGLTIKPIYKELKGWKTDLTKIRTMAEAPKEFLDYITYLEGELDVPVSILSVGPDREQTIIRKKN